MYTCHLKVNAGHMKLTPHSFCVALIAIDKFSSVSWWNFASPNEKSNRATIYTSKEFDLDDCSSSNGYHDTHLPYKVAIFECLLHKLNKERSGRRNHETYDIELVVHWSLFRQLLVLFIKYTRKSNNRSNADYPPPHPTPLPPQASAHCQCRQQDKHLLLNLIHQPKHSSPATNKQSKSKNTSPNR